MTTHPFDIVETISPTEDDPEPRKGNQAYYDWLEATITAATRKPVPWMAVELAITLDRVIRDHEAESDGGPTCAECAARASGSSAPVQGGAE